MDDTSEATNPVMDTEKSQEIPQKTAPETPPMPDEKPLVKETLSRTVQYPAGQKSPFEKGPAAEPAKPAEAVGEDLAGINHKDYEMVTLLKQLADDPLACDYKVLLYRKSPPIHGEYRFVCNRLLKTYDVGTLTDIRDYTLAEFGGGNFEIRLVRPKGGELGAGSYDLVKKMSFPLDPRMYPPIADQFTTIGVSNIPAAVGTPAAQPPKLPETPADELKELHNQRRKMDVEYDVWAKKNEIEDAKARRDAEKARLMREEQREDRATSLDWQARLDAARDKADDRVVGLLSTFLGSKDDRGDRGEGIAAMVGALMKSMGDQSAATMQIFREMGEARREDATKLAEIQAQNNANMMQIMQAMNAQSIEQIKASATKQEALTERLITMRLETPEQRIEQIEKAKASGEERAKQWFQMIEEIRAQAERDAGGGNEELDWDPQAGIIGNVTALAFRGLQRLLTGPNAAAIMSVVNRILGKPATNTRFTDAEVAAAAQQMEPYLTEPAAAQQLPAPAQLQGLPSPAPVHHTQGFTAGQIAPGQGVPSAFPGMTAPPPQRPQPGQIWQIEPAARPIPQPPPPAIDATGSSSHMQSVAVPQVVEVLPPGTAMPIMEEVRIAQVIEEAQETPEDRLRFHVNSMLEEALADLVDQRHVHQWPYAAFESLNRNFLDALARARNDTEKLNLIKQYADPNLFNRVYQIFWRPGGNESYRQFAQGLQQLITLHTESTHVPVATAVS